MSTTLIFQEGQQAWSGLAVFTLELTFRFLITLLHRYKLTTVDPHFSGPQNLNYPELKMAVLLEYFKHRYAFYSSFNRVL